MRCSASAQRGRLGRLTGTPKLVIRGQAKRRHNAVPALGLLELVAAGQTA
jgi:hypothetical protein